MKSHARANHRDETVTFKRPFILPELEGPRPAGTYRLVTDDEEFQGCRFSPFVASGQCCVSRLWRRPGAGTDDFPLAPTRGNTDRARRLPLMIGRR